jgi:small-conductance mechanosensitive channel
LHIFRILLALSLFICAISKSAGDETGLTVDQINQKLDLSRVLLDEAHKSLEDANLTDAQLRQLRERIDPLRGDLEKTIDWLTPRLAAVDARLKELAPAAKPSELPEKQTEAVNKPQAAKPDRSNAPASPNGRQSNTPLPSQKAKAPTAPQDEATNATAEAAASAELTEQRKIFDRTDATLKRARAMLLETKQISITIVARMRDLFTRSLFLRTDGFFSPSLWRAALSDAPWVYDQTRYFWQDERANFVARLGDHQTEFLTLLASILLASPPAFFLARRILRRKDSNLQPTKGQRAAAAGWSALITAATPVATALAIGYALSAYNLLDANGAYLWERLFEGVARIAFVYAIARAVFAPLHEHWRVLDPGDRRARIYVRLLTLAAIILSITRVVEQIEAIVQASVQVVIITRGFGVMLIALLIAIPLLTLSEDEETVAATTQGRDWIALIKTLSALALALIIGACAIGYVSFANFMILQAAWLGAVLFLLYVLVVLSVSGAETAFSPNNFFGRNLIRSLGLNKEQLAPIGVLIGGALTVLAYFVAALFALAPWGYQSHDFLVNIRSAFFAIKIGDVTISPYGVIGAALIFVSLLAATQAFRRWLDTKFLPLTRLDHGFRNSISATLSYIGFILAATLALSYLGIGFDKLAIVAGALSVGIGFGLQSIVNNFVSGLILLWERAIRVGDWVVLGEEQGYVRRINVRSTEIETFDRATMIVPNSNLVTGVVKNWLRGDRVGRIKIALAPSAAVDPEQVRDILLAAARAQTDVLRVPTPQVMLLGMETTSFRFELWCYVEDVEKSARVRSDLHFDLYKRLKDAGINIAAATAPTPTTILQIPDLEKLAAAAAATALTLGSEVTDKLSQTEGTREAPVEQGVGGVSLSQQEDEA